MSLIRDPLRVGLVWRWWEKRRNHRNEYRAATFVGGLYGLVQNAHELNEQFVRRVERYVRDLP